MVHAQLFVVMELSKVVNNVMMEMFKMMMDAQQVVKYNHLKWVQ